MSEHTLAGQRGIILEGLSSHARVNVWTGEEWPPPEVLSILLDDSGLLLMAVIPEAEITPDQEAAFDELVGLGYIRKRFTRRSYSKVEPGPHLMPSARYAEDGWDDDGRTKVGP